MKRKNPADFFSNKKKLFEINDNGKIDNKKINEKADAALKTDAINSFEKEVEVATRDFITNKLHKLAVDYAHKHHENGVTVSNLIKRGLIEIKRELDQSK